MNTFEMLEKAKKDVYKVENPDATLSFLYSICETAEVDGSKSAMIKMGEAIGLFNMLERQSHPGNVYISIQLAEFCVFALEDVVEILEDAEINPK